MTSHVRMRRLATLVVSVPIAVAALAGCATAFGGAGGEVPAGATPTPTAVSTGDPAARTQAQAWLDAVVVPEGATRVDDAPVTFMSYTGWPCSPTEQLKAYWTVPSAGVTDTVNWFGEHPPAGLVSTAFAPLPQDSASDSSAIGFTPDDRSQQGIVFTVEKDADGVAVRAEVAALTSTAVCPTPPDGGQWGLPGQG